MFREQALDLFKRLLKTREQNEHAHSASTDREDSGKGCRIAFSGCPGGCSATPLCGEPPSSRLHHLVSTYTGKCKSCSVLGRNSPAYARRCNSCQEAPAPRAATIWSGSKGEPMGLAAKSGDVRIHSPDFCQSPNMSACSSTLLPSGSA